MDKLRLRRIMLDQVEDVENILKRRIIKRDVEDSIEKRNLAVAIVGVRRAGKTILSLRKFWKCPYLNFDDERLVDFDREDFDKLLDVFYEIYGDFDTVILDEVQNVEGWELFVNRILRKGLTVVVTGSSSKLLSGELATKLTGRNIKFEIYPFSFREFLRFHRLEKLERASDIRKIKAKLSEYSEIGGFPEALSGNWRRYLRDLYSDIIEKDIIRRYNVKYKRKIEELAMHLVRNYSSEVSYNRLKNVLEFRSVETVKNYLRYIESSFLIYLVEHYPVKLSSPLKIPKKVYIVDPGFISIFAERDISMILENLVFLELKKKISYFYPEIEIFHLKSEKFGVDFVLREKGVVRELIQVSYSIEDKETRNREIRSLLIASRRLKCKSLKIITWDEEEEIEINGRKILVTPFWDWALKISL